MPDIVQHGSNNNLQNFKIIIQVNDYQTPFKYIIIIRFNKGSFKKTYYVYRTN